MSKGAKKGENRFKKSQDESVSFRINRLKDHVVPEIKAICDHTYIKNRTKFLKMCTIIFNNDLPVNEKKITHRTIDNNAKYWRIVGKVYHYYYDAKSVKTLESLKNEGVNKLKNIERLENIKAENNKLHEEINTLKKYIANYKIEKTTETTHSDIDLNLIFNLISTIDFLINATDGVVEINKEDRTITNLALDINGTLSKSISSSYFDFIEGKL